MKRPFLSFLLLVSFPLFGQQATNTDGPGNFVQNNYKKGDPVVFEKIVDGKTLYVKGTVEGLGADGNVLIKENNGSRNIIKSNLVYSRKSTHCSSSFCPGDVITAKPSLSDTNVLAIKPNGHLITKQYLSDSDRSNKVVPPTEAILIKKNDESFDMSQPDFCLWENEKVVVLMQSNFKTKTFRSSNDNKAMSDCQKDGLQFCHVVKGATEGRTEIFSLPVYNGDLNFSLPFTRRGEIVGLKLKAKSSEEIQKDMCPVLDKCLKGSVGRKARVFEHYKSHFHCASTESAGVLNSSRDQGKEVGSKDKDADTTSSVTEQ